MASQMKFNIKLTFGFVRQLCGYTTFCVSFSVCPAYLIPENTEGRGVGKTNNLVSPRTFMRYKYFVENSTTYIGFHTRRAVMRARSILGIILCIDLILFLSVWSASLTRQIPCRGLTATAGFIQGVAANFVENRKLAGFSRSIVQSTDATKLARVHLLFLCLCLVGLTLRASCGAQGRSRLRGRVPTSSEARRCHGRGAGKPCNRFPRKEYSNLQSKIYIYTLLHIRMYVYLCTFRWNAYGNRCPK